MFRPLRGQQYQSLLTMRMGEVGSAVGTPQLPSGRSRLCPLGVPAHLWSLVGTIRGVLGTGPALSRDRPCSQLLTPRGFSCLAEPLSSLWAVARLTPARAGPRQQLIPSAPPPCPRRERAVLGLEIRALGVSSVQAGLPRAGMGQACPCVPKDCGNTFSFGSQFCQLSTEDSGWKYDLWT